MTVLKGPAQGREFRLDDALEHNIGRDGGPVDLSDHRVSRNHAIITPAAEGVIIRDKGSTNGTFVNGRRIDGATHLDDGDQVQLGMSLLLVNIIDDDDADEFKPDVAEAMRHVAPMAQPKGAAPVAAGANPTAANAGSGVFGAIMRQVLERLDKIEQTVTTSGSIGASIAPDPEIGRKLDRLITAIESSPTAEVNRRLTEIMRAVNAHALDGAALEDIQHKLEKLTPGAEQPAQPIVGAPAQPADLSPIIAKLDELAARVNQTPAAEPKVDIAALLDDVRQRIETLPHRLDEGEAVHRLVESQIFAKIAPVVEEMRQLLERQDVDQLHTKVDRLLERIESLEGTPVEDRSEQMMITLLEKMDAFAAAQQPGERGDHAAAEPVLQQVLEAVREREPAGDMGEPLMKELHQTEAMLQRVTEQMETLKGQIGEDSSAEVLLLLRSIDEQQRQFTAMLERMASTDATAAPVRVSDFPSPRPRPLSPTEDGPLSGKRGVIAAAVLAIALPVSGWFVFSSWNSVKQTHHALDAMRTTTQTPSGWRAPAPGTR